MKRKEALRLSEIINEVLAVQHLDVKLNETRLIKAWPEILGDSIARYTDKLYISHGVLYVHLSSAVLRNELFICRDMLVKRLNEHIGTEVITNIIFR